MCNTPFKKNLFFFLIKWWIAQINHCRKWSLFLSSLLIDIYLNMWVMWQFCVTQGDVTSYHPVWQGNIFISHDRRWCGKLSPSVTHLKCVNYNVLAKKHVFFVQTLKYCFTNKEFVKSKTKIYNIKKMITQQFNQRRIRW